MTDIEQELYDKGFPADDDEIAGDFSRRGLGGLQVDGPDPRAADDRGLARQAAGGALQPPAREGGSRARGAARWWARRGVGGALSSLAGSSGSGGLSQLASTLGGAGGPSLGALPPGATPPPASRPSARSPPWPRRRCSSCSSRSSRACARCTSPSAGRTASAPRASTSSPTSSRCARAPTGTGRRAPPLSSSRTGVPRRCPGAPGVPADASPDRIPRPSRGSPPARAGHLQRSDPQGNTPPGTPLDPQGRPIRQ